MSNKARKWIFDSAAVILLLLVSFLFGYRYVNFSTVPNEDAAILMRYAKNLGDGNGIVWNVAQKPVDGGTDFLSLVAIAGLYKAGLSLENSVRFLDFLAHFLTLFLIYFAPRKIFNAAPPAAFAGAFFFAIGPGLFYIAAYFSTPFFALFACLSWITALKIMHGATGHRHSAAFALLCLVTGLIRPEGVILSGLMMLSIILYLGIRKSRIPAAWFLSVFILLGGSYFLWRWNYFGHLLPNPFYKKGGGHLYPSSFRNSIGYVLLMGVPFWWIYLAGFRSKKLARLAICTLLPVLGFASAFILLSNETNFAARFQYAVFSIILISWHPFAKDLRNDLWTLRVRNKPFLAKAFLLSMIAAAAGLTAVFYVQACNRMLTVVRQELVFQDGRHDLAVYLKQFNTKGYWMATTEAGLLPLYSEWNDIDTWGLNDPWIAHNGIITEDYLDSYAPEIILFHAYSSPQSSTCVDKYPAWSKMTSVLQKYAEESPYTLASVFGVEPCDTYYYYVRTDFPDSKIIIESIRNFNYRMGGVTSKNYVN